MKFLKLYFTDILFIILIIFVIYIQRDWLVTEYNRLQDLRLSSYIKGKSIDKANGVNFAEESKRQFAFQLDRLIAFTFGGFCIIIIRQLKFNKKDKNQNKLDS